MSILPPKCVCYRFCIFPSRDRNTNDQDIEAKSINTLNLKAADLFWWTIHGIHQYKQQCQSPSTDAPSINNQDNNIRQYTSRLLVTDDADSIRGDYTLSQHDSEMLLYNAVRNARILVHDILLVGILSRQAKPWVILAGPQLNNVDGTTRVSTGSYICRVPEEH